MNLLSGAEISIMFDPQSERFFARVVVGHTSETASGFWPEQAIGRAVMMLAGVTEAKLKNEEAA